MVDKETIFTAANVRYEVLLHNELHDYMKDREPNDWETYHEKRAQIAEHGNPFYRALALIDRRVGKRTIEQFEIETEKQPLVRVFYELRTKSVRYF